MLFTLLPLLLLSAINVNAKEHFKRVVTSAAQVCPPNKINAAYFPNWTGQSAFDLDWKSLDLVFYFAVPTTSTGVSITSDNTQGLADFTKAALKAGKKPIITFGGWDGSAFFSTLVSTPAKRTALVKQMKTYITTFGFQGIDIDWEYIGAAGATKAYSQNDADNFLYFLQLLRPAVGTRVLLTAALPTKVFTGVKGAKVNLLPYSYFLNYITVMNYDMYGPWSDTTGPNSALDGCRPENVGGKQAIQTWIDAGFPKCQILYGIPTYGHQFQTASSTLTPMVIKAGLTTKMYQTKVDYDDRGGVTFNQLILNGYLTSNGLNGAGGYIRYYDACTSTPFLFNSKTNSFISYDDVASTKLKVQYAHDLGLAGVNFYETSGAPATTFDAAKAVLIK